MGRGYDDRHYHDKKSNRRSSIASFKKQKNKNPNQDKYKYSKIKEIGKTLAIGALIIFAGYVGKNVMETQMAFNDINSKVEALNLSYNDTKALKDQLKTAYKDFSSTTNGYKNKKEAFPFYENQMIDAAKHGKNVIVLSDQIRAIMWDSSERAKTDIPNSVCKKFNPEKTMKNLKTFFANK